MTAKSFACATQSIALCFLLSGCQSTQRVSPDVSTPPAIVTDTSTTSSVSPTVAEPDTPPATSPSLSEAPDSMASVSLSIWPTLREGMQLQHALEQTRVQQELRWLKDNPDYLKRLQPRLQKYLPYLLEQTRERRLPTELALIPIVESALDPYAFSPGGASGLWQFMRPTAKQYGLNIDRWYDGRRDVIAATEAALDYLQVLYKRLGSWHLAIAAYNGGGARVARAVKRAASEDFFQLRLPKETQYYLPRVLALAALITAPEQNGVLLPEVSNIHIFAKLSLPSQYDLSIASELIGLDYAELKSWNPALKRWASAAVGPHHLIVPRSISGKDERPLDLDRIARRLQDTSPKERMRWKEITIKTGDSLSVLAQRYNTDIATLKAANNLTGTSIRAGKPLLIPMNSAPSNNAKLMTPGTIAYRVKPGDSLWSVAKRHDVTIAKLVKINQVGPREVLQIGRTLQIPTQTARPPAAMTTYQDIIRKIAYRVRKGDSLARIAKRFQVTVKDLAKWNRLDVKRYLQPGQRLTIYVDVLDA